MATTRRPLLLNEWAAAEVPLTADDALALQGGPGEIAVESLGGGRYRVVPSRWIGSIALSHTDVLIRPKVGVERLFFHIGYAQRLRFEAEAVSLERDADITEAVVRAFLDQTRRTLRGGPLMAYTGVEDALSTIRGRVRFLDQTRRHFLLPLPVEASYDEYTVDTEKNRILKAALERAERLPLRTR